MIEKIQDVLIVVEKEKEELLSMMDEMEVKAKGLSDENSKLKQKQEELTTQYEKILKEYELADLSRNNLEKENSELKNKFYHLENSTKKQYDKNIDQSEKQVRELTQKIEDLRDQKKVLREQLSSTVNAKEFSDDIQNMQLEKLNIVENENSKLNTENEKLSNKLTLALKAISELENNIEKKEKEVEEVKEMNKYTINKLNIENENRIKEIKNELLNDRELRITGLSAKMGTGLSFYDSGLGDLGIGSKRETFKNTLTLPENDQTIDEILQRGSLVREGLSNTNEMLNLQKSNKDFVNSYRTNTITEENTDYLEEIQEKDAEILKLKKENVRLREEKDEERKDDPRLEEQVKKLELDLKHCCENLELEKIKAEKNKTHLENSLKEFEEFHVKKVMKYQINLSEKDHLILAHIKNEKLLNFQIGLYEDQINKFNSKNKRK